MATKPPNRFSSIAPYNKHIYNSEAQARQELTVRLNNVKEDMRQLGLALEQVRMAFGEDFHETMAKEVYRQMTIPLRREIDRHVLTSNRDEVLKFYGREYVAKWLLGANK